MSSRHKLWNILKRVWQIWIILVSILLGFGIVQISFIKVTVPESWKGYIIAGIILLGVIIVITISIYETNKLKKEVSEVQSKLFDLQNTLPFIPVLGEVPVYVLMSHFAKKLSGRARNQVRLDLLELSVKVHGTERNKDASVAWRFKGKNTHNRSISSFYTSIAGENVIPFSELNCLVFDILSDGNRGEPRTPHLLGADSNHKDLLLPFRAPGILPGGTFDIELTYTWPGIVKPLKDYWFLEPRSYALEAKEFRFLFEGQAKSVKAALAFTLNTDERKRGCKIKCVSWLSMEELRRRQVEEENDDHSTRTTRRTTQRLPDPAGSLWGKRDYQAAHQRND